VIRTFEDLERILRLVFADKTPPKPLHLIPVISQARARGLSAKEAARLAGSTVKRLKTLLAAPDPLETILGTSIPPLTPERERKVRSSLGS